MSSGRLIGIVLAVVGVGIAVFGGLWLASQVQLYATTKGISGTSSGGALLGGVILFIPVALLVGFGVFSYLRGGVQEQQDSVMQKQRQLLDIIKSRGQVQVNDLAVEMHVPVDSVRDMVHQLVGLQVFSGYVNWKDGMLYSTDASQLRALDKCKNCGGELTLAGKGVVVCKFCGTEYFLS